jgi:hypothetical protein
LAILTISIATALLIGCGASVDDSFSPPEYVYLTEIITFPTRPGGTEVVDRFAVSDELVFFSTVEYGERRESADRLMSMELDGTNPERLPEYRPYLPERNYTHGFVSIISMYVDINGYLWIIENGVFSVIDFSSGGDSAPVPEIFRTSTLRKLTSSGEGLVAIDISDIVGDSLVHFITLCIDDAGNFFITTFDTIFVLDTNGMLIFTLRIQGNFNRIVRLPDGTVARFGWFNQQQVLQPIDVGRKTWGEHIVLPPLNIKDVFPGNDEFLVVFVDGASLFGISAETGEALQILNWTDSGLISDGIGNIRFLADGRLMAISQYRAVTADQMVTDLVILTRTPYEELQERSMLTLATFFRHSLMHLSRHYRKSMR